MGAIEDIGGYVRAAQDLELPAGAPRPGATAGSPHEAAAVLHADATLEVGVWECTPGTFPGAREGYNELMVFLSGSGTITPEGGEPVAIGPGTVYPTFDGWRGTWDVRETVRKVYVIWGRA